MQNFISTETSSQTAMACEQAALFGATPGPDEFDNREIWNVEEALAGIEEAIHILAGTVAPDGTQLADERGSLLWGFVNALHAQVQRNLSTILRHRRFLFTDSLLLLWK